MGFQVRALLLLSLVVLSACAPGVQTEAVGQQVVNEDAVYVGLAAPFELDLRQLGVVVTGRSVYYYSGNDQNGFIEATNTFYRENPGFCPIQNAFYAAASGTQFMTLASDGSTNVRGFLYDQSRRPRLTYAYFTGVSDQPLTSTICETAPSD